MSGVSKNYGLLWVLIILVSLVALIFYIDFNSSRDVLTVAFLDVGQGDAIFIESPTGSQVLVDGGPPRRILGGLTRAMPLFDRSINMLVVTNPDRDHIGGFLDVLKKYKIKQVLEPGTLNEDSSVFYELNSQLENKKIPRILARKGMQFDLGGGAFLEIIFPDRDVSSWNTNEGSIVARLSYGEISIMLTGDSVSETERIILSENDAISLDSDILKVGHHGSKTSSSLDFVKAVSPEYAVISSGKNNSYGHPHKEVLDVLASSGVQILRTDTSGTIIFKCDKIGECKIKKSKN